MEKLIKVQDLAVKLASLIIVKITSEASNLTPDEAAKRLFKKSEDGELEVIPDLKEDYEALIDHYLKIILEHEA